MPWINRWPFWQRDPVYPPNYPPANQPGITINTGVPSPPTVGMRPGGVPDETPNVIPPGSPPPPDPYPREPYVPLYRDPAYIIVGALIIVLVVVICFWLFYV